VALSSYDRSLGHVGGALIVLDAYEAITLVLGG